MNKYVKNIGLMSGVALFTLILSSQTVMSAGCIEGGCTGYNKTEAQCQGKDAIRCPFDTSKYFCQDDVCAGYYTVEYLANNLNGSCVLRQYDKDQCINLIKTDSAGEEASDQKISWFLGGLLGIKSACAGELFGERHDPCVLCTTTYLGKCPNWCHFDESMEGSEVEAGTEDETVNPILIIKEKCADDETKVKAYWDCPEGFFYSINIGDTSGAPGTCTKGL